MRHPMNAGKGAAVLFLTQNQCECHPLLEVDRRIDGYSLTRLLRSQMLAHPIGTLSSRFFSRFFKRVTTKRYCHRSKWGLITKNPHIGQ